MTLRTIMPSGPNGPYLQGEYVRTGPDGRITIRLDGEEISGHPCPITRERLRALPAQVLESR